MKNDVVLRVVVSGAACVLVLVSMLLLHAQPLWVGEPIYLEVRPVDPRDVFRGDYVILSYPVQQIEPDVERRGEGWDDLKRDEIVYAQVRAEASNVEGVPERHVLVSVSREPVDGAINLRARVRGRGSWLRLHYGIDAFFVQEREGLAIEEAIRGSQPVYAEIFVTSSGRARVADLIIEGRRVTSD